VGQRSGGGPGRIYLRVRTTVEGIIFGLVTFAAFAADAGLRNALGVAPYPPS
jgi:hypothetical protein